MKIKCRECGKEFNKKERGYKLVSKPFTPYPLCPRCVMLNKDVHCNNCNKAFKLKEGWLDECWICKKKICSFCSISITIKGLSFSFCEEHRNYNKRQLDEDAIEILEYKEKLANPKQGGENETIKHTKR